VKRSPSRLLAGLLLLAGLAIAIPGVVLIARHYEHRTGIQHAIATVEGMAVVLAGLVVAVSPWLARGLARLGRLIRDEWRRG
jgi:hypothetical protein